jgi:hypothetical protein
MESNQLCEKLALYDFRGLPTMTMAVRWYSFRSNSGRLTERYQTHCKPEVLFKGSLSIYAGRRTCSDLLSLVLDKFIIAGT